MINFLSAAYVPGSILSALPGSVLVYQHYESVCSFAPISEVRDRRHRENKVTEVVSG